MNRLYTNKLDKLKLMDEIFYPLVETIPIRFNKEKVPNKLLFTN